MDSGETKCFLSFPITPVDQARDVLVAANRLIDADSSTMGLSVSAGILQAAAANESADATRTAADKLHDPALRTALRSDPERVLLGQR